jgi:hypothetical protein
MQASKLPIRTWYLAMGLRDALYNLNDSIEMDEGFSSIATPKGTKLKRGKRSQKQKNVAVLVESILQKILKQVRKRVK